MPSSLIVKCAPIKAVREHPNADKLVIVDIMGWQVVTAKDTNPQVGDLRVFIPPDAVLSDELAKELEVEKYLKKGNRVGQVKLRQQMSFGIAAVNKWGFQIGEEVSEKLGITKWEPPLLPNSGDQERDHPLFSNYSRIENWRNFPDVFTEENFVVITEKIHGTNSKIGLIREDDGTITEMIGSHNTRRKIVDPDDESTCKKMSLYQYPLKVVRPMLDAVLVEMNARVVIVYGEIFGRVQDLKYGRPNDLAYRAFDLYVDGKPLDWDTAEEWFSSFEVDHVPVVYCGPYSELAVKDFANQNTLLMPPQSAHMSEGVIIRPQEETTHPELGRLILKYKSDAYEDRFAKQKGTEFA